MARTDKNRLHDPRGPVPWVKKVEGLSGEGTVARHHREPDAHQVYPNCQRSSRRPLATCWHITTYVNSSHAHRLRATARRCASAGGAHRCCGAHRSHMAERCAWAGQGIGRRSEMKREKALHYVAIVLHSSSHWGCSTIQSGRQEPSTRRQAGARALTTTYIVFAGRSRLVAPCSLHASLSAPWCIRHPKGRNPTTILTLS